MLQDRTGSARTASELMLRPLMPGLSAAPVRSCRCCLPLSAGVRLRWIVFVSVRRMSKRSFSHPHGDFSPRFSRSTLTSAGVFQIGALWAPTYSPGLPRIMSRDSGGERADPIGFLPGPQNPPGQPRPWRVTGAPAPSQTSTLLYTPSFQVSLSFLMRHFSQCHWEITDPHRGVSLGC